METLLHNPIAEMYGPSFLILYGGLLAIAFLVSQFLRKKEDKTALPIPKVPSQPDPYQIAYLRGGSVYAIELVCFSLLQRGYLALQGESFVISTESPSPAELNSLERTVFDRFKEARSLEAIRQDRTLKAAVKKCYRQSTKDEHLLFSEMQQKVSLIFHAIALAFFLSLAGYKVLTALINGHHNIQILSSMAFVAALYFISRLNRAPVRLTQRGSDYIQSIKMAFESVKVEAHSPERSNLAIALFGHSKLVGTPYAQYSAFFLFQDNKSLSSASVSASKRSGSSSGDSNSCGGGCGSSCSGGCGGCGGD
ncbi:TIGR04222 domain-containing membrane protein [Oscillatoria sp. FACHB-1406]|uniref:TIGR04222 domain-containing membrane protein n=1 Tax=Oscillatoria sp. FACHB-1406 TaxID=2692846 RepID=UPI00168243A1|nr:TIGR04222 domain-containing membrane protein [Oscillatoria sp. FACHB-1406]MBD2576211.1 TIGR04222 domain-containing membrane protein [Oscillatoria sp. FACHB-1406]